MFVLHHSAHVGVQFTEGFPGRNWIYIPKYMALPFCKWSYCLGFKISKSYRYAYVDARYLPVVVTSLSWLAVLALRLSLAGKMVTLLQVRLLPFLLQPFAVNNKIMGRFNNGKMRRWRDGNNLILHNDTSMYLKCN